MKESCFNALYKSWCKNSGQYHTLYLEYQIKKVTRTLNTPEAESGANDEQASIVDRLNLPWAPLSDQTNGTIRNKNQCTRNCPTTVKKHVFVGCCSVHWHVNIQNVHALHLLKHVKHYRPIIAQNVILNNI